MVQEAKTSVTHIRRFQLTAIGEYIGQLAHGMRHPSLLRSGATRAEARKPLPGDELIPRPMWQRTRGETINAPAADIFPWLLQLGYGRAGWYSWFPLQANPVLAASCCSAEGIHPEFQNLKNGLLSATVTPLCSGRCSRASSGASSELMIGG